MEKNPGKDKVLFFIHGNSGSSRTWEKQFSSELFDPFHLVAFDLPGCGQSLIDDQSDWDYSLLSKGKLLAKAISLMSKDRPFYLIGFSLGTNIIGEMLNNNLNPAGITLASSCIVGDGYGMDKVFVPGDNIFFHDEPGAEQVTLFFRDNLLNADETEVIVNAEDFFQALTPFRSALIASAVQGKLTDEIDTLKKKNIPVQVIFGLEDKMLQVDYLDQFPFSFWNNKVYKLSGAGHYVHYDQPIQFNTLLAEYLTTMADSN